MIRALKTGLRDGRGAPYDLSMGMTYPGKWRQRAYDWGCNLGQWIGRKVQA